MSFWRETEYVGRVINAPEYHEIQPRVGTTHTSGIRRLVFRLEESSGRIWSVRYEGPLEGSIQLGDMVAVRGYARSTGVVRATRIYHAGGDRPIRIASINRICLLTLCLAWCPLVLTAGLWVRDRVLTGHPSGERVITAYYDVGQSVYVHWQLLMKDK